MKIFQKIVLFVGFLTLAVGGSATRYTNEEVAAAATAHYNKRSTRPNLFKLLQISTAKTQIHNQLILYIIRFFVQETICHRDGEVNDVVDCAFKEDGMKKKCIASAIQNSLGQLKLHQVHCKRFLFQVPPDVPVLARQTRPL
ncbi:cathelicidin-6-like [Narcine bancroftii]|uniref:cathelicidin-6-like n=1 Tax=Narcine bancroftii TaxID=1343680 RepID=UPI003831D004